MPMQYFRSLLYKSLIEQKTFLRFRRRLYLLMPNEVTLPLPTGHRGSLLAFRNTQMEPFPGNLSNTPRWPTHLDWCLTNKHRHKSEPFILPLKVHRGSSAMPLDNGPTLHNKPIENALAVTPNDDRNNFIWYLFFQVLILKILFIYFFYVSNCWAFWEASLFIQQKKNSNLTI